MRPLVANHPVQYVTADKKIVTAKIIEPRGSTHARLELGDNAFADAAYNEDKSTPNTFHFKEDDDAKPAAKKAFTPGEAAK